MHKENKLPVLNTKIGRVFLFLLQGYSYNRFEAEWKLYDHCLPQTIAALQSRFGIKILRKFETIPGYKGSPTKCCRYWIEINERLRLQKLCIETGLLFNINENFDEDFKYV